MKKSIFYKAIITFSFIGLFVMIGAMYAPGFDTWYGIRTFHKAASTLFPSLKSNHFFGKFYYPSGLAMDNSGNLIVADAGNHAIRKISPDGNIVTIAGRSGVAGNVDGVALEAEFRMPSDVAVDLSGNIYVADQGNFTIRKIAIDGMVTTLAGKPGQSGFVNGPGNIAQFGPLMGIAVDAKGNVYAADVSNEIIRMISPDGMVSTFAGSAKKPGKAEGKVGNLNIPKDVAVDKHGVVFVADWNNCMIRKITSDGSIINYAGVPTQLGSEDGVKNKGKLRGPSSIAFDYSGNMYVAETNYRSIRKIDFHGTLSTLISSDSNDDQPLSLPKGIAVDAVGNIYLADSLSNTIRRIDSKTGKLSVFAGVVGKRGRSDTL